MANPFSITTISSERNLGKVLYSGQIFFLFCFFYQFLVHLGLSLIGMKDELKPYFDYSSPYIVFSILAILYLPVAIIRRRWFFIFFFTILVFLAMASGIKHFFDGNFIGNTLKSLQFFWGILIVFTGSVSFLEYTRIRNDNLPQNLVNIALLFVAAITIFEFFASNFVFNPTTSFFYKYLDVIVIDELIFRIRPVGVALYAQPNSVLLVYLITLHMLYRIKGGQISKLGVVAVLTSMGGTGISSLILIYLVKSINSVLKVFLAMMGIALVFLFIFQFMSGISEKFEIKYLGLLYEIFLRAADNFLDGFTIENILFGIGEFTAEYSPGVTHDWAYFDVFYEYGVLGLSLYVMVYTTIIFYALPRSVSRKIGWWLVVFFLVTNFHYATLNYFFGQMMFGVLAAIGYCNRLNFKPDGLKLKRQ